MNESHQPPLDIPPLPQKEETPSPAEVARVLQESIEQPELKGRILEMLRERGGFEDPEVQGLLGEWRDKAEGEVKKSRERRPGILLDLSTADFYLAARDPKEAALTLFWARNRLLQNADSEYKLSNEDASEDLLGEVRKKLGEIASVFGRDIVEEAFDEVEAEIASRV